MNTTGESSWSRFWHPPVLGVQYTVAKAALVVTAIWILLSRPGLPEILALPAPLLENVSPARFVRFLMLGGAPAERVAYWLALATLVLCVTGPGRRIWCFVSGLLLYNLAPLETIIWSGNPYLRGLTIPVLGLLVLSFGSGGSVERGRYRATYDGWQLRLIQVFICQMYLFAGYSKLFMSGLSWASAENMSQTILILDQVLGYEWDSTLGALLRDQEQVMWLMGLGGLLFDLTFWVVLFSRRARWVYLPAAVVFHVANHVVFHISFPGLAWLLVFVGWGEHVRIRTVK